MVLGDKMDKTLGGLFRFTLVLQGLASSVGASFGTIWAV